MNSSRNGYLLFAVAMLFFLLACGGLEPDTEPIPTFPDAEPISSDFNAITQLMEDEMTKAIEAEGFDVTTEFYQLPDDNTFSEVEEFYDEELTGREWTKSDDIQEMDTGDVVAWEYGPDQAFVIMSMPSSVSEVPVLMTLEARK